MVSEYVSFAPPSNVGMKMVEGPWFFEMFAGGCGDEAVLAAARAASGSIVRRASRAGGQEGHPRRT